MPEIPTGYASLVQAVALLLLVLWLFAMRKPIADWLRHQPKVETLSRWKRILALLRGRD